MRARAETASGSACVTHAWDATQGSRGANARTPTILSTQLLRNGPSIFFRDVINIDAPPRLCKVGCKLGHCDSKRISDFMDLFIYVVLHEWGKLFFYWNEGLKFWNIKNSIMRNFWKNLSSEKRWEIILKLKGNFLKVKEKSDWEINLKKIKNYQNYIVLIKRLLSNRII